MAEPIAAPTTPIPAAPEAFAKPPSTEATGAETGSAAAEDDGFQTELITAAELLEQQAMSDDARTRLPGVELEADGKDLDEAELEIEDLPLPELADFGAGLRTANAPSGGAAAPQTQGAATALSELAAQPAAPNTSIEPSGIQPAAGPALEAAPTPPAVETEPLSDQEIFRPPRPAATGARSAELATQALRAEDATRVEARGSAFESSGEGQGRGDASPDAPFRLPQAQELLEQPLAQKFEAVAQAEVAARPTASQAGDVRVLPEIPVRNEAEIVQQTRVLIQNGGGQARIQLHPPQLGELGVKLVVTEHSVQLGFTAERAALAELLARHLPELRQAMDAQGLQIDRFSVDVRHRDGEGGAFPSADRSFERDQWGAPRRQPSGDFGDFSLSNGSFVRATRMTSLGAVDVHV
jgi:flagellar hook-length control protein FliK